MDEVELLAKSVDPLLSCCICQQLLREAVQLKCLHNCCRQCFRTAATSAGSERLICTACRSVTPDGSEQPNGFIDGQVQLYRAVAESRVCGVCKGDGIHEKPALMWCAACRHSLCSDCLAGHQKYNREHVTQSLEGLRSLEEVCMLPSASACEKHGKPLEVACLNCEQAKCISCWAECHEKEHKMHFVGRESFDCYVGGFIASIASLESELLRKSEVLQKPKSLLLDRKATRDRHLEEIVARKRQVLDVVDAVFQRIESTTKNVYDELEAEDHEAATVADQIDANLSDARYYVRRLLESNQKCEILNQQKMVRERLIALSAELDRFSKRLTRTMREVRIEAAMPDDLEEVIRPWIGTPWVCAASWSDATSSPQLSKQQEQEQEQASLHSSFRPTSEQPQQQSFLFDAASISFQLPEHCLDVALTQDGRSLLLATEQNGLIELSSASGRELSRWLPPKLSRSDEHDEDYQVSAVAALSDGRAAVSLFRAQCVLLLRRKESSGTAAAAADDDAWTEDRRIQLQLSPLFLSAHGDVLAAVNCQQLLLLSLSSERKLSDAVLQCEYEIGSLAVAARMVITGSLDVVELGGDRQAAHVLEAHNLDRDADGGSDKRLWRRVLSSCSSIEQEVVKLLSICVDSIGTCLYAAVMSTDLTDICSVTALSLADGSQLQRIVLSTISIATLFSFCSTADRAAVESKLVCQPLLAPVRLSLCDERASAEQQQQQGSTGSSSSSSGSRQLVLAVLCKDLAAKNMTVKLHRSSSNRQPCKLSFMEFVNILGDIELLNGF